MKVVKVTKTPTVHTMLNMAANLKEKYNRSSCVVIHAWNFTSQGSPADNRANYDIYVEGIDSSYQNSWAKCQDAYFKLMEETDKMDHSLCEATE